MGETGFSFRVSCAVRCEIERERQSERDGAFSAALRKTSFGMTFAVFLGAKNSRRGGELLPEREREIEIVLWR